MAISLPFMLSQANAEFKANGTGSDIRVKAGLPAAGMLSELVGRRRGGYDVVIARYDTTVNGENFIYLGVKLKTTNPVSPPVTFGSATGNPLSTDQSKVDSFMSFRRNGVGLQNYSYFLSVYGTQADGTVGALATVGHTLESSTGNIVTNSTNRKEVWDWMLARVGQTIHIDR